MGMLRHLATTLASVRYTMNPRAHGPHVVVFPPSSTSTNWGSRMFAYGVEDVEVVAVNRNEAHTLVHVRKVH